MIYEYMIIYTICREHEQTPQKRPRLEALEATELARLFKALASPTRLKLLAALRDRERCVHDLVGELHAEQSAVSHQLRVLRDLRIVRARQDGRHVFYALDDTHVRHLYDYGLRHVREGAGEV